MTKHDPEMFTRKGLNALPVAAPDVPEEEHFFTCQQCSQRVDYRRLGDVLYHDEPHTDPLPPEEPWEPTFIETMQPTLVDEPPEGDGWHHEIKYDGYRMQLHIHIAISPCPDTKDWRGFAGDDVDRGGFGEIRKRR